VLYQMLTGRLPFVGDVPAIVASQHAQRPPSPPSMLKPGLPAWLNRVVLTALAKNPSERFPSAEAMLRALEPARFGAAGGHPTLVAGRRFKKAAFRPRLAIPRNLVAIGLILVLTLFGVVVGRDFWESRGRDALASSNGPAQSALSPTAIPQPSSPGAAVASKPSPRTPIPTEAAVTSVFQQVGVVWPHDGQGNAVGLDQARAVNVSLWPRVQVSCDVQPETGVLWMARDNEPAQPVAGDAQVVLALVDGAQFPMLVVNGVPADTTSPGTSYRFFVRSPDSNVWVHAADPRSNLTEPVFPTEHSDQNPRQVDVRIQVVWPHDGRGESVPVERATAVNIAVDLFAHGTTRSVPLDFEPELVLRVAAGNNPLREQNEAGQPIASVTRTTHVVDDRTFPRWVFNNVPVQPGSQYHFLIDITGGAEIAYPSIWTHGHDAELRQAAPSIPPSCRS
jgi:hypothetical protein